MPRCATIKADGQRCKAQAMAGYDQCYVHNDAIAETRTRNNSRAGRSGGRGRTARTEIRDIKKRLYDLASDVLDESVEKGVGAVASQILNVYLRALGMEVKIREVEELEARLEELEELLEAKRRDSHHYGA